jgi:hypothetical protein
MNRLSGMPLYALVSFSAGVSLAQTKKTVNTAADLPRFSCPVSVPASMK